MRSSRNSTRWVALRKVLPCGAHALCGRHVPPMHAPHVHGWLLQALQQELQGKQALQQQMKELEAQLAATRVGGSPTFAVHFSLTCTMLSCTLVAHLLLLPGSIHVHVHSCFTMFRWCVHAQMVDLRDMCQIMWSSVWVPVQAEDSPVPVPDKQSQTGECGVQGQGHRGRCQCKTAGGHLSWWLLRATGSCMLINHEHVLFAQTT